MLRHIATLLLERLESSMVTLPPALRWIFSKINSKMATRHNSSAAFTAVGTCWLLQLVGPTLACPQKMAKYSTSAVAFTPAVRRGLVLLSKLLNQMLLTSSSSKKAREEYMQYMDSFVKRKMPQLKRSMKAVCAFSTPKAAAAVEKHAVCGGHPATNTAREILGCWGNGQ